MNVALVHPRLSPLCELLIDMTAILFSLGYPDRLARKPFITKIYDFPVQPLSLISVWQRERGAKAPLVIELPQHEL
jgi:hypothetical protein